jgi:UDP-glucose 4-epimerase
MAILVTGGAGFIGSHVVKDLIAMGEEVIVIDDLSGGFRENVDPRATFIEGTVTDNVLVEKVFKEHRIEYVFHLAAYAAEGLSHFIKRFNYENNLIGSVNLINASVNYRAKCFVFASSIAVYGAAQLPMREEMLPVPEDSYGIAKLAVELELKASQHMFALNYIIFRPHNVYGENQNIGDKYRNVVGIFMNQIMRGEALTIFGDGTQTRAFTYIRDVSPIIAKSIRMPEVYNEVFNIGSDEVVTVKELAMLVSEIFGVEPKIRYLEPRKEVKHAFSDHSKLIKNFNYLPRYSLKEGTRAMAAWVKKVGSRQSKKFQNIEIMRNLPAGWLE